MEIKLTEFVEVVAIADLYITKLENQIRNWELKTTPIADKDLKYLRASITAIQTNYRNGEPIIFVDDRNSPKIIDDR